MTKCSLLAFAGSARQDSFNKKTLAIAVRGAEQAGAQVTVLDLRNFSLPLYDGDLEDREGLPENARKLKTLFLAHQGLLIASPEYNSGYTPLLKNTLDWVSRSLPGEAPLTAYQNKTAALMSASPGGLGGLRGLSQIRAVLGNIGVLVLPQQIAVSKAHEAFNADGSLKDPRQQKALEALGATLAEITQKLQLSI